MATDGNGQQDGGPHGNANEGEAVGQGRIFHINGDVGDDGEGQHHEDNEDPPPIDMGVLVAVLDDRGVGVLLLGAEVTDDAQGDTGGHVGIQHGEGTDPIDPHHGGGGIPHHGACPPRHWKRRRWRPGNRHGLGT